MSRIIFNFQGVLVTLDSDWIEIIDVLKKDFSHFLVHGSVSLAHKKETDLSIKVQNEIPPHYKLPTMIASMQTMRSICYDQQHLRFNDYYGELISILDTAKSEGMIFSKNFELAHEVTAWLILSRVRKILDLRGMHMLHAFSVSYDDKAIVCTTPSKGGKSTLLLELLKDRRFKILSDDYPLISFKGNVRPFPIRIALHKNPLGLDLPMKIIDPNQNIYSMSRKQSGKEWLISLQGFPERVEEVGKEFSKIILIDAVRYNCKQSVLKKINSLQSLEGLFKHGVVGLELPLILEYFRERSYKNFFLKAYIFFSRLLSFSILSIRAKTLKLYLGTDPERAAQEIIRFIEKNSESK